MNGIQPLDATDADACAALAGKAVRLSPGQYVEEFKRNDRCWVGIRDDNRLVAFAGRWDAPDVAHVLAVVVASDHRRQGLGGALLDHVLDGAAGRGLTAATLEVRRDNDAAIALYRSRGFEVTGQRAGYYQDGDATLMGRQIAGVEVA